MGGHVAEKLLCGSGKITTGCGSDLEKATSMAYKAVRSAGMYGDLVSYNSSDFNNSSEEYNAKVDKTVQLILDVSLQQRRLCLCSSLTLVVININIELMCYLRSV